MSKRLTPETILDDYIAGLLCETSSQSRVDTLPETLDPIRRAQLQSLLDHPASANPPLVQASLDAAPMAIRAKSIMQTASLPAVDPSAEPRNQGAASALQVEEDVGRPGWGLRTFDALQFRVAGLNLAVPLTSLGQIYPLNDELTPVFGQANWLLGIQPCRQGLLKVVNTARFIMPERYRDEFRLLATYVISIDGTEWGLSVDTVCQPMRLNPDDVTWRTRRSQRPWLAGTVKAALCALLDLPRLGELLQANDAASHHASPNKRTT